MIFTLLALALAPGAAIALYIYLKDKHEREPIIAPSSVRVWHA